MVGVGPELVDGGLPQMLRLELAASPRGRAKSIQAAGSQAHREPRTNRPAGRVVVACALPGFDEHIVEHVFGFVPVVKEAESHGHQTGRVAVVETAECASLPACEEAKQLAVVRPVVAHGCSVPQGMPERNGSRSKRSPL